jgi:hypothetical protein
MSEPRQLVFSEGWADTDFSGQPLIESVLRAFVGRCQACGRSAEAQREGSVLIDPLLLEGTLYGDTYCLSCQDEEPEGFVFVLPPQDDGREV